MFTVIAVVVALAVGFGIGRIKNAARCAAIWNELRAVEAAGVTDAKAVIAAVRAKL